MEQDLHFIGQMAGLKMDHQKHRQKSSGGGSADLAKKYFKGVNKEVVKELHRLYEVDFEMFEYSVESYKL